MKQVVIIGAGPAGLAVGACLARRHIAHTVLERGAQIASGLRRVDPEMRLFSPARLSRMPGMRKDALSSTYPAFGEFVEALERYGSEQKVVVETGVNVTAVTHDGDGFTVEGVDQRLAERRFPASHVISATGLVATPRLPEGFDLAAPRPWRWMHSVDVRAADVAGARSLLVVGGGASAAEVLSLWLRVRSSADRAAISLRSPLRAIPETILGVDSHYFSWLPEHLPARPLGPWLLSKDAMFGRAVPRQIARGAIEQVPAVAAYQGEQVRLVDGRALNPDLLVLATGFTHVSRHLGALVALDKQGWPLARRCQSTVTPRLYLLGTRFARTLASPYLRGIARDAVFVARRIERDR